MTIIKPNSIAGVTSITAQGDTINFYKSDGTLAGLLLEGVNFNTTVGVSTFNNVTIGGTITYQDVAHVDSVGIITAQQGIQVLANGLNVTGVSTFNSKLTLAASSTAYDAFQVGDGLFVGNTSDNVSAAIFHQGGGADLEIGSQDAITFTTGSTAGNATERLRITSSGNIGIGTAGPNGLLHVAGGVALVSNAGDTGAIKLAGGGSWNTITSSQGSVNTTAKDLAIFLGSSEALRIDSSGRLLIGTTTSRSVANDQSTVQIEGISGADSAISLTRNSNTGFGPYIYFGKSRGTSIGASTIVNNGDSLGRIRWAGADGTDANSLAGEIDFQVDGTPGANEMPGRLVFSTNDGTTNASPTERMRIDSSGNVGIGDLGSGSGNLSIQDTGGNTIWMIGRSSDDTSSISFRNNADNAYIARIAADNSGALQFRGASNERARIDSSGRLLVGTDSNFAAGTKAQFTTTAAQACSLVIERDNGNLVGNQPVGEILFNSTSGGVSETNASISVAADVAQGSGDKPGRLVFSTTADGASSPTERMRISSNGDINIDSGAFYFDAVNNRFGVNTTSPTNSLHVSGSGQHGALIGSTNAGGAFLTLDGDANGDGSGSDYAFILHNTDGDLDLVNLKSGVITFSGTSDSEKVRIDSSGRLLVGTSTARSNYLNSSSFSGLLQIEGTNNSTRIVSFVHNTSGAEQPLLVLGKSRGTTAGSNTVVQSGDNLGILSFHGADGSELVEAARVEAVVDGTPGANDMPGRLVFSTTADGASSVTERLRIDSAGRVITKYAANGEIDTLSDGATITPDFNASNHFTVTLGGNRTLANPSNITAGQSGFIAIVQDGTGSRTLSFGSYWDFASGTAPTLTTTASAVDVLAYYVRSSTSIVADVILNVS